MKAFYQHDFKSEQCRIRRVLEYRLHFHHQVEVVYMLKGEGKAIIEGEEYELRSGDILTVFPNQLHEYMTGEDQEFFITIFKPEILPDFKDIFYNMIPENSVYSTDNQNKLLLEIARNLPKIFSDEHKFNEQIFKGLLTAFFGELFSLQPLTKVKSADISVLKSMLLFCNDNYLGDISLDKAAKALHVSKYYLSHLINNKLKISFNDHINSLRIADAVQMIDAGQGGMTEIAQKCGFNTARTFNRAFKNIYGISPSKYKKQGAKGK